VSELNLRIVFDEDVTAEEADSYTRGLLGGLERLDIDTVELTPGAAESGTRTDAATLIGAITLAGSAVMAVLPHVVQVVVAWLEQTGQRSVVIERDGRRIEVTGRVRPADIEAMWNLLGQGDAEADGSGQSDESADR
jgi:hypothetical protein